MVDACRIDDSALEEILRQGRELRDKARLKRQDVPKLASRSGICTPMRSRLKQSTPARKPPTDSHQEKVNDDANLQEIQRKGRKIREMLRTVTPKAGNHSHTSLPIKSKRAVTPVKNQQSTSEILLRTPVGSPCPSFRGVDVDKWSNQVSSRSVASTTTPSQTSARSLRCTPAASPQSSARSRQSSARSIKTLTAWTPPMSGRPPRAPGWRHPVELSNSTVKAPADLFGEKAVIPREVQGVQRAPSSVLLLPERMAEAAQSGDVEMISQCISELPAGASVCEKDAYGWSSLHYAAAGGHFEVCQLLLEARGDANVELPDFSTPLMLAVEEGGMLVAELLLKHGAKVRSKDEAGFTVMDRCAPAALSEFMRLVQLHQ